MTRRKPMQNNPSRKILYLMEFDETPMFWYPRLACDAWINFAFCSDKNLCSISINLRDKSEFLTLLSLSFSHFLSSLTLTVRFLFCEKWSLFLLFDFSFFLFLFFSFLFFLYFLFFPLFSLFLSFFSFFFFFLIWFLSNRTPLLLHSHFF